MKADTYVQFPLYLLAYGEDIQSRLNAIVVHGAVTAGDGFIFKQKEDFVVDGFYQSIMPDEADYLDGSVDVEQCKRIAIGMDVLKLKPDLVRYRSMKRELNPACAFCAAMAKKFGDSPLVRIKTTYANEVMNGRGMDYRVFSILCAIYSVIGNKEYARITRDCIRARSMGYKKASELFSDKSVLTPNGEALLAERADGARPLTTDQIRYSLDKMEIGHFARVVASNREVYFSHRMNRDTLSETILGLKTDRSTKLRINRLDDKGLQSRIKERLHYLRDMVSASDLTEVSSVSPYARFTAKAEGIPSPTYQWFSIGSDQTGRPLAGETKPDLVIITPPVGTSQYLVTATNSEGTVQSKITTLTVEQKIKLEAVGAPTKPPKPGVDFFGKIDSRETALKIIRAVVVINIVLGLLPGFVMGFIRPIGFAAIISLGICAFTTFILGVYKSRAVAVFQSIIAMVFTALYSYQCLDDRMMYLSAFLQLLYTIATIRAVEATIKLHGTFAYTQNTVVLPPTRRFLTSNGGSEVQSKQPETEKQSKKKGGRVSSLVFSVIVVAALWIFYPNWTRDLDNWIFHHLSKSASQTGQDESASLSTDDLQAKIRQNIEKYFSEKPNLANVQIIDFKLFHKSGYKYDGTLFYQLGSKVGQSDVDVTYDGSSFKWKIAPADSPTANPSTVHRLGTAAGAWSVRFGEDLADTKGISLYDFLLTDTDGTIGGHVDALNPGGEMVEGARSGNRIEFHCQMKSLRGDIYSLKFTGTVNRNSMSGEVAIKNETSTSWKNDITTTLWTASYP